MTIAAIFGEIILGLLLADLITGIFHWWEDRVGKESWPIVGPWIIIPNRLHHVKPLAFTKTSFMSRNLASLAAALVVGAIWWCLAGFSILMITALLAGGLSNEIHRFTHEPRKCGPVLKVLQEIGILQSPKGHARHHRPPQDANYCVVTDWLNPIFEALQVWTRLERLLRIRP